MEDDTTTTVTVPSATPAPPVAPVAPTPVTPVQPQPEPITPSQNYDDHRTSEEPVQTQQTSQIQATAQPAFTAEQVMQMMSQMYQPQATSTAAQPAVDQMTPEQRAEHLKTFSADENFTRSFVEALTPDSEGNVNLAAVQGVLHHLRDGYVAQSVRAAELLLERQMGQLNGQLAPMQQHFQTQAREHAWTQFSGQFPQFANYRPMVDAIATQIAPTIPPTWTKEQKVNYLAQQVQAQLQVMGINPIMQQAQSGTPLPQQPSPSSPVMNPGVMTTVPPQGGTQPNANMQKVGGAFYDPILD